MGVECTRLLDDLGGGAVLVGVVGGGEGRGGSDGWFGTG